MILDLCYYPNPILRKQCKTVIKITPEIKKLVEDMIETMDVNNGVGLAANQVGALHRLFVIRPIIKKGDEYFLGQAEVYINPRLSNPSTKKEVMTEGCLSFPSLHLEIERPYSIKIEAMNLEEKIVTHTFEGFKAREVMHENDHLNGKYFIDRISPKFRNKIQPQLNQIKKRYS